MASIKDDKGYNQGFKPSLALYARTERRCNYIIGKMNLGSNIRILEIGCGTGEISFLLAQKTGNEVLGTDICQSFIEGAQKKYSLPNLKFQVADFNTARWNNEKFDYIIGNGILHHLFYNLDAALKNIRNLLNQNGKIIFLEPNIFNPYCFLIFRLAPFRKLSHLEPDEMAFSKKFIEIRLAEVGFADIEVKYKDFLLPNTPPSLIKPIIKIGAWLEKIPLIKMLSQSIFISASIDG